MDSDLGLKPLNETSIKYLEDLYHQLIKPRGADSCFFCHGGNTCRCGQCPEFEYHDTDCLVYLLDIMIWNYHHPRERASSTLVLTTKEEIEWYRKRIKELEEAHGEENHDRTRL